MKFSSIAGYFAVFFCAILVGYWIGFKLSEPSGSKFQLEHNNPPAEMPESQVNMLIFHINKFKSRPNLRVIWLAAYKPGAGLKVVPVFPNLQPTSEFDRQILDAFSLYEEKGSWNLDQRIIDLFLSKGIIWNGIVLIDDYALTSLVQLNGLADPNSHSLVKDQLLTRPNGWESPTFLRKVWQDLCWNIFTYPEKIDMLGDDFFEHIQIDTNHEMSVEFLSIITERDVPLCEFPFPATTAP